MDKIKLEQLYPKVNPQGRWGGWPAAAFEKNSQALIVAVDDVGLILEHVGAHIDYEVTEGAGINVEDAGLAPPEDGIWIWEGKYHVYECGYETREWESEPRGEFRRLTRDELELLAAGKTVLKEQPLNPDFCGRVAKAVEDNNTKAIGEAFDVCLSEDMNHDSIYVLFAEACGWEATSASRERFKTLWLNVSRKELDL